MRRLLKRVLGQRPGKLDLASFVEPVIGDLAHGNWEPLPVSATPVSWNHVPEPAAKPTAAPKPPPVPEIALLESAPKSRRVARRPAKPAESRRVAPPSPNSRPRRRSFSGLRVRSNGDGGKWRDLLKSYGEHLTDEELVIIRRQLATQG